MARNDGPFPSTLTHPTAGASSLDPIRVAIRWRPAGADDDRETLLASLSLLGTHCSSCEPMREEGMRIKLEQDRLRARRACLEAELLELELERRRAGTALPAPSDPGQ